MTWGREGSKPASSCRKSPTRALSRLGRGIDYLATHDLDGLPITAFGHGFGARVAADLTGLLAAGESLLLVVILVRVPGILDLSTLRQKAFAALAETSKNENS